MVGVVALAFVAIVVLAMIGMTAVQFRRVTPLVFRCQRCGHEFRQPPHRDFARACPRCGADDWAR
jgi:Zn finger protein HypA/HybF involved in hydrogenase expression